MAQTISAIMLVNSTQSNMVKACLLLLKAFISDPDPGFSLTRSVLLLILKPEMALNLLEGPATEHLIAVFEQHAKNCFMLT